MAIYDPRRTPRACRPAQCATSAAQRRGQAAPAAAAPDARDVWTRLREPIPDGALRFRQDGKPRTNDRGTAAPYVVYIDAGAVRRRLDQVVPGEWDVDLTVLPSLTGDGGEVEHAARCAFTARLTVLGVRRESVGTGKDYKAADADAFKRAAARFGIGAELRIGGQFWVPGTENGRFFTPTKAPLEAFVAWRESRRSRGA